MLQSLQIGLNFEYCRAIKCCGYCRHLKNVANVAETFSRKKQNYYNVADPTICSNVAELKKTLPNVAKSLKNVANHAEPSK